MNIIGGGPAGLWTAKKAADLGLKPVVHEEHTRIGSPEHCTGLLSNNIDKIIEPEVVLNYINGARFISGDREVLLERRKVARVIDRPEFDRQVCEEALASGAKINRGKKVHWKDFKGDIVAADGAAGRTRSDMGQKLGFLPALQFDLRETPEEDFVELWFEPWSGFFAWVVPRGNRMRVGTAARDLRPLKDFVVKRFGRFRKTKQYSGLVVTSGPVGKTYFDLGGRRIFLVGDAAGQVKPTSGGGIVVGMSSAEKLVRAVFEENPSSYERLWRAEFGRELFLQRVVQRMMVQNPGGFVSFLERGKAHLEAHGDMDRQTAVLPKIAFPALVWLLGSLFKRK